ncbi:MAG: serine hydrolase [Alteraurantiacibacter sp. bin_em_oilr2.035]|uniref:serine hydrolase domain-containing protein n=1 Tax=Aurantiacibacter atlanticus TaxID=1648404 RepID=UPI0007C4A957|nr:serine hydrolase domain-containing protein [Aurantiacibacter atlanticus]MDF1835570.1 serine hydrolase [Alteraurantiacibacter sp. bin_em_oilr2.035]
MHRILALAASLAILVPLPVNAETVEQVYGDWLTAFNSGEEAALQAFYGERMGDPDAVFAIDTALATCGFDPVRVETMTERTITVLLAERCFPALQRLHIELGPGGETKLGALELTPLALTVEGATDAVARFTGRLAARDDFAGSLLITRHGQSILAHSWGTSVGEEGKPITLDTPMYLASAGKMFTAVSILQLVDAGQIALDAPLGTYLTDYSNKEMAKVTIRQLLQHRGGTGDTHILARTDDVNRAGVRTIDDIIALNDDRAPRFSPGSEAEYSNYGFILLGAVIERVSGQSYYDYVSDHIFSPGGMITAGYPDRDNSQTIATGLTTFYGEEDDPVSNIEILPWRGMPDGGGVASANDLQSFFNAMQRGTLLSPAMFDLATTPGQTPWYGAGFVTGSAPYVSWGHGGNSYGMDVAAHYYPAVDTTFICLATRDMACNRLIWFWAPKVLGSSE